MDARIWFRETIWARTPIDCKPIIKLLRLLLLMILCIYCIIRMLLLLLYIYTFITYIFFYFCFCQIHWNFFFFFFHAYICMRVFFLLPWLFEMIKWLLLSVLSFSPWPIITSFSFTNKNAFQFNSIVLTCCVGATSSGVSPCWSCEVFIVTSEPQSRRISANST